MLFNTVHYQACIPLLNFFELTLIVFEQELENLPIGPQTS